MWWFKISHFLSHFVRRRAEVVRKLNRAGSIYYLARLDRWIIDTKTPGNHQSYNQQVYLKELFDLKHTIMQCNYETFEYLQDQL